MPARLPAGEVVALYHYREAERLEGPAVVGESVLLQEHEAARDKARSASLGVDPARISSRLLQPKKKPLLLLLDWGYR